MSDVRGKRQRRQAKQAVKHGAKAKPTHKLIAGRTGMKAAKQEPSKKNSGYAVELPNLPPPSWWRP